MDYSKWDALSIDDDEEDISPQKQLKDEVLRGMRAGDEKALTAWLDLEPMSDRHWEQVIGEEPMRFLFPNGG